MPKFIIRRVETFEVEADNKIEAGKLAMIFTNSNKVEELSVDYYYGESLDDEIFDIAQIYELVPYRS